MLLASAVMEAFASFGAELLAAYCALVSGNVEHRATLEEFVHDMLLALPYKDVGRETRVAYEALALLAVLALLEIDSANVEDNEHIFRLLDLAKLDELAIIKAIRLLDEIIIIVGSPLFHQLELELIDRLHRHLPSLVMNDMSSTPLSIENKTTIASVDVHVFNAVTMNSTQPLIIRGAVAQWPCIDKWTVAYFAQHFGYRVVPVELGTSYADQTWTQQLMRMDTFLSKHVLQKSISSIVPEWVLSDEESSPTSKRQKIHHRQEKNEVPIAYLAQHDLFYQFPSLKSDIAVPDYIHEMPESTSQQEDIHVRTNVWFGPVNTKTPLHHDGDTRNFFAQIQGSKYFRLYSPAESGRLYPHEGMMSNTSQVDIMHPDYDTFPLFKKAQYTEGVLQAGDLLYLPVTFPVVYGVVR